MYFSIPLQSTYSILYCFICMSHLTRGITILRAPIRNSLLFSLSSLHLSLLLSFSLPSILNFILFILLLLSSFILLFFSFSRSLPSPPSCRLPIDAWLSLLPLYYDHRGSLPRQILPLVLLIRSCFRSIHDPFAFAHDLTSVRVSTLF